jgi:ParB-like chromosome segregation protein Spo0J
MKLEHRPIARPVSYSKNSRRNDGAAVSKVKASLQEFGWQQPIVLR